MPVCPGEVRRREERGRHRNSIQVVTQARDCAPEKWLHDGKSGGGAIVGSARGGTKIAVKRWLAPG